MARAETPKTLDKMRNFVEAVKFHLIKNPATDDLKEISRTSAR